MLFALEKQKYMFVDYALLGGLKHYLLEASFYSKE